MILTRARRAVVRPGSGPMVGLVGVLALLSPASSATPPPPAVRGMALGHYTDIKNATLDQKLTELRELGVTHVSLVVSWSSKDVRSAAIAPRKDYSTPDDVLDRIIRRTHGAGFKVFLFPILDIQRRKPLEWRGTLKPASWDRWWRSYRKFIIHYARIAARHGVAQFCVGSELVSTEGMRQRWQPLIGEIRKIFKGKLVYSANWDHYAPVSFWDLVDLVGLTGYYKLAAQKGAPEQEMVASWTQVRRKLVRWSRRIRRPILFTELGYPSMAGSAVHPWDYTLSAPPDMEEQRRALSSFVRVWAGTPELTGVYFWDWYGEGGPRDTRYTPRGKPGAAVIGQWYRGSVRSTVVR